MTLQCSSPRSSAPAATRRKLVCQSLNVICSRSPRRSSPRRQHRSAGCALVKKANQVLRDPLVLRDLLARQVLRARKVLLALQVLPRTPFELYASTVRPQRAEGSATRTRYL